MEIKADPKFREWILNKIREREFSVREGIHMSDLNYCLNKSAFRRLYPLEDTDHETLLYSIGWATQRWLTGQDTDEPEREVQGITVTLDCVADGENAMMPWELKATYQSNTKAIEENVPWLRQIMAQCYVTGTTEAKLSRFCLMGNWKWVYRPSKPEKIAELVKEFGENWADHPTLEAYSLQFTQAELDKMWQWFLERKQLFQQILSSGKPLPRALALPSGQEWECEYCKYLKECNGEVD